MSDLHDLEHYALQASYGRLTGVAIATHAIRDGYLLMHVGVGCKNKVTHLLTHDWVQTANLRQGWTEVGDQDLITGASVRVGPYLRSWAARMDSGFVCVVGVTFLELAGEDMADEVARAAAEMPVPVALIPALGFDGDEYDGYAAVCKAVIEQLPWADATVQPRKVSVLGYLYDRYEGDHEGNLTQLRSLLKAMGLELGPTVLSGQPFDALRAVPTSGTLIALPYLDPVEKRLRRHWKRSGRAPVRTDLPMGLSGTDRWMRAVGQAAGVDAVRVQAAIEHRRRNVEGPVQRLRSRLGGKRVAVFAEAPLAAGLCTMLLELDLPPVLVGLRGTSLGGEQALREVIAANGLALPDDTEILEAPSLRRIHDRAAHWIRSGQLGGILGSATELNAITTLTATEAGAPSCGPFLLEIGFPCHDYHAVVQMPYLGYGGVATLGQRLITARRLWDTGRLGS